MRRVMVAAVVGVLLSHSAGAAPDSAPTTGMLQRAWEAVRPALVEVQGPHRAGLGFFVGADGRVLTTVDYVALESAQVQLPGRAQLLAGKVTSANARLRLATVKVESEDAFPTLPVSSRHPVVGDWVIGVERGRPGALTPRLGQVLSVGNVKDPLWRTDVAASNGSPLLDTRGHLLGLVVGRGAQGAKVLPLPWVRMELERSQAP